MDESRYRTLVGRGPITDIAWSNKKTRREVVVGWEIQDCYAALNVIGGNVNAGSRLQGLSCQGNHASCPFFFFFLGGEVFFFYRAAE